MNNMNLPFLARFFVMIVASIMLISCANTVVTKPVPELKIRVSIRFDSFIDTGRYNYYFIFSSQTPKTISKSDGPFFIPGDATNRLGIDDDQLPDFYEDYFSTWDGVFTIGEPTLQSTMGPFPTDTSLDGHENYSLIVANSFNYEVSSNTISFTVYESDLGGINDRLYYTVVMTKKTQDSTNQGNTIDINNIQDDLNASQSIALMPNESNNYSDDGVSDDGIQSCDVQVK